MPLQLNMRKRKEVSVYAIEPRRYVRGAQQSYNFAFFIRFLELN